MIPVKMLFLSYFSIMQIEKKNKKKKKNLDNWSDTTNPCDTYV